MSKKLIRKRVGKPTGETTKAGRPVYKTETGERRSEYSSTIKLDNGKWINIPSIHNGKYYTDDELKNAVEDNRMIPTSEHSSEKEAIKSAEKRSKELKQGGLLKAHKGNEGGTIMDQQMEMSFGDTPIAKLAEGGMKDDGGEKDPVSGNDVPSGATAKEVRDDVPAMVSEGEFIFPADVTRFIGLDKLMELRQDAKMGLKKMEMMGQLGDPEDAELPDDIPFDDNDIIIEFGEEEVVEERNQGGIVGFAPGSADAGGQGNQYYDIAKEANKAYAKQYTWYKNDAGNMIPILTDFRGNPLDPVPAGYKLMLNEDGSPVTKKPENAPDDNLEGTQPTQPMEQKKDDDDKPDPAKVAEQNRESAKITADRLGFESVDDYLALSFKDRMKLVGEEFRVMGGGETDHDRVQGILDGSIDGGWDGSLFGGIFSTIGSIFDRDNDGSMWTSTDKDGNVRNIFGQIIQTGVDVSKMGILKDGRWTGDSVAKKPKDSKNKGTGNELTGSLKTPTFDIDEKKQGFQARKHGSYKGVTKSDPYASKAAQFKRDEDKDFRPGQVFETKKQKQDKEDKIRDFGQTSNRGTSSGKSRAKAKALATSKNVSVDTARGLSGAGMEAADASRDKTSYPFNEGSLVTKRKTTKKPTTQRKALVGKY